MEAKKHLGQSISLVIVMALSSAGIVGLMVMSSGALR